MVTAMPDAAGIMIAKVPATIISALSPIDQPVARLISLFTFILLCLSFFFWFVFDFPNWHSEPIPVRHKSSPPPGAHGTSSTLPFIPFATMS